MDLVGGYESDSESECEAKEHLETKNQLPALPFEILDKFHKAPSFYMRKLSQSFAAPNGYYNNYCSLEFLPNNSQLNFLDSVFVNLHMLEKASPKFNKIPPFRRLYSRNGINDPLHVSLSSDIFLTMVEKIEFQSNLKSKLQTVRRTTDDSIISFDRIKLFWNNNKTRLFATLLLSQRSQSYISSLHELVMDLYRETSKNSLFQKSAIAFEPGGLHVSIAETDGLVPFLEDEDLLELDHEVADIYIPQDLSFSFDSVKVQNGTSRMSLKVGGDVV